MREEHCKTESTLLVKGNLSPPEFARWMLATIPEHSFPQYFSRGEVLRRRPEFEVANSDALEHYLTTQTFYWFHTDALLIDTGSSIRNYQDVKVFSRSAPKASRLLHDWIPILDKQGLYYVKAGAPQEFDHRNGLDVTISDNRGGIGHLWVGRKYDRYVPGLYWLNYFSFEFATMHGVDIERITQLQGAKIDKLKCGYLVQLYESPDQWPEFKDSVDDFLFSATGFFSKRRVNVPLEVRAIELVPLISQLGKDWP
ncbi:MAG: hypothetical protein ACYTF1_03090 [Planctomycetota bacterium]|jgi:hypothetical protein